MGTVANHESKALLSNYKIIVTNHRIIVKIHKVTVTNTEVPQVHVSKSLKKLVTVHQTITQQITATVANHTIIQKITVPNRPQCYYHNSL